MAQVNHMVKLSFKETFELISKPFLVITLPVIVFAGYLLYGQLTGAGESIAQLSQEINKLSVAVAHLESDARD